MDSETQTMIKTTAFVGNIKLKATSSPNGMLIKGLVALNMTIFVRVDWSSTGRGRKASVEDSGWAFKKVEAGPAGG